MIEKLNNIMKDEILSLEKLLGALDKQHEYIVKNEILKLEKVVEEIEECNREIAKWEMERRNLTKGKTMSSIVEELKDMEIDNNYRKMRALLEELNVQKDANEMLIKQGLGFTTRMLQILNPDRSAKTYSPYGKMK